MKERYRGPRTLLLFALVGVSAAIVFVGARVWLNDDDSSRDGSMALANPVATAPDSLAEHLNTKPSDSPRANVEIQPAKSEEEEPGSLEVTTAAEKPVEDSGIPVAAQSPFPYGRPTPDWVFEQKYAGKSPSEIQLAKETIQAEYKLASLKAFNEQFDAGNFEVIPAGQPPVGAPGDERIISGRSMPNSPDTRLARLEFDQYPQVYELWFEYLWLATQR